MREGWQDYNNGEYSAGYYSNYPLFNVIYQNKTLMDKYHTYMMDCARIYALGGRTTDNETYEPAYMASLLDEISDELIEAATEKTTETASYMNFIWQPSDLIKALPNIKQIAADRAVGVYSQLSGLGSWVSCSDCDLSAVGNGQKGKGRSKGYLSVTDPDTGIFATAQYTGGKPAISVKRYESGETEWNQIKELLPEAIDLMVYDITDQGVISGDYTVTVPASSERLKAGTKLVLYSADETGVHALETVKSGNLYSASLTEPGRIILAQINDLPIEDTEKEDGSVFNRDTLIVAGIGLGMLLLAVAVIELVQRFGKKKA